MSEITQMNHLMNVYEKMLLLPLKDVFEDNIQCVNPVYYLWREAYLENKPLPINNKINTLLIAKALSEGFSIDLTDQFKNNQIPIWLIQLTYKKDLFKKNELENKLIINQSITLDSRQAKETINTLLYWCSNLNLNFEEDKIHPRLSQMTKFLTIFFKNKEPEFRDMHTISLLKEMLVILEETKNKKDFDFVEKFAKKGNLNGFKFVDFFKIKDILLYENFKNNSNGSKLDHLTALLLANQLDKPLSKERIDSLLQCDIFIFYEILRKKQMYCTKPYGNNKENLKKEFYDLEKQLINHPDFTVEKCFDLFEVENVYNRNNYFSDSLFPHHLNQWIETIEGLNAIGVEVNSENSLYLFEKNYFDVYVKNKTITIENNEDLNLTLGI